MNLLELLGWIGATCFAICAFPQAYKSYKDGNSAGISWGLLSLWMVGELCMLAYISPKRDYPLILNYVGNIISVGIIIKYKILPRK